jgi:hypothetical protein
MDGRRNGIKLTTGLGWRADCRPESFRDGARPAGDIVNVGGFSDAVFSVVAAFLADAVGRFVAEVERVESEEEGPRFMAAHLLRICPSDYRCRRWLT